MSRVRKTRPLPLGLPVKKAGPMRDVQRIDCAPVEA